MNIDTYVIMCVIRVHETAETKRPASFLKMLKLVETIPFNIYDYKTIRILVALATSQTDSVKHKVSRLSGSHLRNLTEKFGLKNYL